MSASATSSLSWTSTVRLSPCRSPASSVPWTPGAGVACRADRGRAAHDRGACRPDHGVRAHQRDVGARGPVRRARGPGGPLVHVRRRPRRHRRAVGRRRRACGARARRGPAHARPAGADPTITTRLDLLLERRAEPRGGGDRAGGVVLSGVVATALLVLVLAASLLVRRRRRVLAHQRALGASLGAVAGAAAAESLALVIVGSSVGLTVAQLVVPGPVPWAWVVPPVVLAALVGPCSPCARRASRGPTARPPHRSARAAGRCPAAPPGRAHRPAARGREPAHPAGAGSPVGRRQPRRRPGRHVRPVLVAAAVAVLLLRLLPPVARWARRSASGTRGPIPIVAVARTRWRPCP